MFLKAFSAASLSPFACSFRFFSVLLKSLLAPTLDFPIRFPAKAPTPAPNTPPVIAPTLLNLANLCLYAISASDFVAFGFD